MFTKSKHNILRLLSQITTILCLRLLGSDEHRYSNVESRIFKPKKKIIFHLKKKEKKSYKTLNWTSRLHYPKKKKKNYSQTSKRGGNHQALRLWYLAKSEMKIPELSLTIIWFQMLVTTYYIVNYLIEHSRWLFDGE